MKQTLAHPGFGFLQKAGLVLFAFQLAAVARMLLTGGMDELPNGFLLVVMVTAIFSTVHGRIAGDPSVQQGLGWLFPVRLLVLLVLTSATLIVVFYRVLPPATPQLASQAMFSALWVLIALKGAAIGKLKPNGFIGLRVRWTLDSRLAWDKAHRALGRVLFFGGLAGLALSFMLPPYTSVALWFATVACAAAYGLLTARNAWRQDPDRMG